MTTLRLLSQSRLFRAVRTAAVPQSGLPPPEETPQRQEDSEMNTAVTHVANPPHLNRDGGGHMCVHITLYRDGCSGVLDGGCVGTGIGDCRVGCGSFNPFDGCCCVFSGDFVGEFEPCQCARNFRDRFGGRE